MTRETPVKAYTRKKPAPAWKSGPFADEIAARLEAKRSGVIACAKPETAPVGILGPMPAWLKRMVLPHAIKQVADRWRGM